MAKTALHLHLYSAVKDHRSPTVLRDGELYSYRSVGGDNRDRTGDLLLAKQALSQLSYIPVLKTRWNLVVLLSISGMVGLGRVELPTSRLSGVRSNHLSYRPILGGRSRSGHGRVSLADQETAAERP
jgi:hypothetical protein